MILTREAKRKLWPVVSFAASVALAIEGGLTGVTHGFARIGWVCGAAVTTGLQAVAGSRDRKVREDEITDAADAVGRERARSNLALGDTLMPLLRVITRINEEAKGTKRRELEEGALQAIVAAVASSIGPHNARSCFFEMRWGSNGQPDELMFVTAHGRADEPHSKFIAGTQLGDKMFRMIRSDGYEFCDDTEKHPPEAWEDHPHEYRTFISVPVRTDTVVYGVLTVDAPEAGQLDEERDKPLLAVLARVLAASRPFNDTAAARTVQFMAQ